MFTNNDLFISPQGSDAWSGRLPEPNAEKTDGPLVSLEGARRKIRALKQPAYMQPDPDAAGGLAAPFTVWLRGGVYSLREPVVFEPKDTAAVTYAAYPDETPILDGGERISGWRTEKVGEKTAWVVDLPEVKTGSWHFRSLFVNGRRAARPRLPKQGLFRMAEAPGMGESVGGWGPGGQTLFIAAEGDARPFANLNDVEVVYVHFWVEERSTIASFDPETRLVTMARPSTMRLSGAHGSDLADYYLDNVFEALDEPGQWYLDRENGKLYYLPLPGEDPETAEVYAPRLLQLIGLVGKPEENLYVEMLRFQGITFRHTDWRHPDPSDGASFIKGASTPRIFSRGNKAAAAQAAADVPGVVYLEGACHIAFEDCTVEHVGWYGIEIADACRGIRVVGNTINDMGAGGVKINGSDASRPVLRRTGNCRVSDNVIHAGGRIFHSAVGVLAMHASQLAIRHNHIYDLYYTGISCGWVWGYTESVTRDNLIEKNHIHDIGQGMLSDMGGIYTLGVQPGTVLRGNLIHDVTRTHYGGWCIYPDEGSSHILIEQNICYSTNGEVFHQHYGRENIVRNNIFAFGGDAQVTHSRVDPEHKGFTLERNVIITDGAPAITSGYSGLLSAKNLIVDLNLYFDVQDRPITFKDRRTDEEYTFEQWQALGYDRHSLVADPKCKDIAKHDFTLADDSPAFELGFEPIDLSDVGPRPKELEEEDRILVEKVKKSMEDAKWLGPEASMQALQEFLEPEE